MARKLTEQEFLERSENKHGGKYDYSFVEYVNTSVKVEIGCRACGTTFAMTPESHMAGQGCRACGYAKNGKAKHASYEEFVEKANLLHENKFDYSNIVWKGNKAKVTLLCPVHQESFEISPYSHLKGADCPKCAAVKRGLKTRSNTEVFIKSSKEKHGDRYDYSQVEYVKSDEPVRIRCTVHDSWLNVTPNFHLNSAGGCVECANEATSARCRKTTEQFIKDAQLIHGERYSYDRSVYKTVSEKIEIKCREHGYFWQIAGSHTQGQGCPSCGNSGYKVHKPAYLYVLCDGELTKVGITNNKPQFRCNFISRDSGRLFKVISTFYFENGQTPLDIETKLLEQLWKTYESPTEKFSGFTECFFSVDQPSLLTRITQLIQEHSDAQTKQ